MSSKRWCYTLNNYSSDELAMVEAIPARYHVIGKEIGSSGTPHLQGFVTFPQKKRLAAMKKLIPRAHFEVTVGTSQQAADYCKKDGDFKEFGMVPNQGSRTDLEAFKEVVKTGVIDRKELRELFSEVWAKYPRFCNDYVTDHLPELEIPFHELREWQVDVCSIIKRPPDRRTVHFIVDEKGNSGKSWLAQHCRKVYSDVFVMRPGKHADMAYTLPDKVRTLFLDCTRQQLEYLPYTFLEELKDGYVMSTKYECRIKEYPPMHVFVLMNQFPDMEKLSADRYNIIELK